MYFSFSFCTQNYSLKSNSLYTRPFKHHDAEVTFEKFVVPVEQTEEIDFFYFWYFLLFVMRVALTEVGRYVKKLLV